MRLSWSLTNCRAHSPKWPEQQLVAHAIADDRVPLALLKGVGMVPEGVGSFELFVDEGRVSDAEAQFWRGDSFEVIGRSEKGEDFLARQR